MPYKMYLAPSDIRYSQDSISNTFGYGTMHGGQLIGETLDELIKNPNTIKQIPTIQVFNRHGIWYTTDNRRLWVFRKAEELEIISSVPVIETFKFNSFKFTSFNGGKSVHIRRYDPGGFVWRQRQRQLEENRQQSTQRERVGGRVWLESTENFINRRHQTAQYVENKDLAYQGGYDHIHVLNSQHSEPNINSGITCGIVCLVVIIFLFYLMWRY